MTIPSVGETLPMEHAGTAVDHISPTAPESIAVVELSARERATAEELARLNPQLASLYRHGHELVRRSEDQATVYMLAHAGRELGRGVVRLLAEPEGLLDKAAEMELNKNEKNRVTIAAVLQLPVQHASVTAWFRANETFSNSVHFRTPGPSLAEVRTAFLQLSELLYGRVAPYFATHLELDQLLSLAAPSSAAIERARSLLVRPPQRHYFFTHLEHRTWLAPLADAGYFATPPDLVTASDGQQRAQPWPEGQFLIKVAAQEPVRVTQILRSVKPAIKNPVVWNTIVSAAAVMPGENARVLVPGIMQALRSARCFAHSVVDLVAHLAAEQEESAFKLAEALLWTARQPDLSQTMTEVQAVARSAWGADTEWMLERIGSYELEQFCQEVVPALERLDAARTLKLLAGCLDKTVSLGALMRDAQLMHTSQWWCENLEHLDHDRDVRRQLAVAANALAVRMVMRDAASATLIWGILERYKADIFKRIRLNVLASAGSYLQEQLDAAVGGDTLLDQDFGAHEAAALLRAQFLNASAIARRLFCYAVERGPAPDAIGAARYWGEADVSLDVLEGDGEGKERTLSGELEPETSTQAQAPVESSELSAGGTPTDSEIKEVVKRWQRRRLRWFHDRIPDELSTLARRLGVTPAVPSPRDQKVDEVGFFTECGWIGERSPQEPESLVAMSEQELVDYLVAWDPGAEDFGSPSRSGLERALSAYASSTPEQAVAVAELGVKFLMAEEYFAALLAGLAGAAEAGHAIPWDRVVVVLKQALSITEGVTGAVQSELAIDRLRRRGDPRAPVRLLARAAAELIEKACSREWMPAHQSEAVWKYADAAVRSDVTWSESPGSLELSTFGDILSASVNTLGGQVTEMLMNIALWDYRHAARGAAQNAENTSFPEVVSKLVPLVEHILLQTGRGALGAHAMIGAYLPQLYLLAPDWMRANQTLLLEDGARVPTKRPIWGAYLTRARLYDSFFRDLRHWYVVAAKSAAATRERNELEMEWSAKHLGLHVIIAVVRGLCMVGDPDALVETTFSNISAKERANAYWSIFRGWSDTEVPVPEEMASRLISFWKWRVSMLEQSSDDKGREEEAAGLVWFIKTPFVPAADAIRLGCRTLSLMSGKNGKYRTSNTAWERMAKIAAAAPAASFELTELFVHHALEAEHIYLPFGQVAPVLRAALTCDDASVRQRAERLVHCLGERGLFDYGQLIGRADV